MRRLEDAPEYVGVVEIQILVNNEYWKTLMKVDTLNYHIFYKIVADKWKTVDIRVIGDGDPKNRWEYLQR